MGNPRTATGESGVGRSCGAGKGSPRAESMERWGNPRGGTVMAQDLVAASARPKADEAG